MDRCKLRTLPPMRPSLPFILILFCAHDLMHSQHAHVCALTHTHTRARTLHILFKTEVALLTQVHPEL